MQAAAARFTRTILKTALLFGALSALPVAHADPITPGWTAENMEVLGYTIMDGRPGFKISMTRAGDRWYAITAHYNVPGWSVIDVTDPRDPKTVKFIPGPANTNTVDRKSTRLNSSH